MLAQRVLGMLLLVGGASLAGCDDPCVELSRQRCDCERNETAQRACRQRVDETEPTRDATQAEFDCCSRLLDTCTCERLAAGDLAACGVAQESDSSPPAECRAADPSD